jgi:uncharacterized protein YndB with AHSA1/START domain
MPAGTSVTFDHALTIAAPPARVLQAFFEADALADWWQVARSITTPRSLGVYAVQWEPTGFRDEVLGPLGGVFYGTVVDYVDRREFFLAECYWLPPEGDPIGPMALEVRCSVDDDDGTLLHVKQSGYEPSLRWSRYYAVITAGWIASLKALKAYVEAQPAP